MLTTTTPLVTSTNSTGRQRDNARPRTYWTSVRLSNLEMDRDALRELVKQAKPTERFRR